MKTFVLLAVSIIIVSCYPTEKSIEESKISDKNLYKPGLGELMLNIELHHNKIKLLAEKENWDYVNFEIKELKEIFETISKYHKNRKEIIHLQMIEPAIVSLKIIVNSNNKEDFNNAFIHLTNTCNDCHKLTGYEFIVVEE